MVEIASITFDVVIAIGGFSVVRELVTGSASETQYKYAHVRVVVAGVCGNTRCAGMSGRVVLPT